MFGLAAKCAGRVMLAVIEAEGASAAAFSGDGRGGGSSKMQLFLRKTS